MFYFAVFSLQAAITTLEASIQKSHEQIEKKDASLLALQDQLSQVSCREDRNSKINIDIVLDSIRP